MDSWHDSGTGKTLSFNDSGMFVDEDGKGPQKGFQNTDEFADWLHAYVVKRMLQEGLIELKVPEGGSPIYHSPNAFKSPEKLLVLIQGTGRVRVGVWSVGVCAYAGLGAGSALSAIAEAKKRGMEVVVLNPNDPLSSLLRDRYSNTFGMVAHTLAVFEDHIIPGNPKRVWIICHSMGGECTISTLEKFPEWSISHIRAVAMTDACEMGIWDKGFMMKKWCNDHCINWVCSDKPADTPLHPGPASTHRSAGTKDHPLSTHKAFQFIWVFFDQKGASSQIDDPADIQPYKGDEQKPESSGFW